MRIERRFKRSVRIEDGLAQTETARRVSATQSSWGEGSNRMFPPTAATRSVIGGREVKVDFLE